jgi:HK97 family phage portal protein
MNFKIPFFNKTKAETRSSLDSWLELFGLASKTKVSRNQAMEISSVFRCISVLTNGVSTLPAILYKKLPDDGKERAKKHPLYLKLKLKPNNRQTAIDFYEQIMMSLCMRGNAYVHKIMTFAGEVEELYVIHPDNIKAKEISNGRLQYEYFNKSTNEKRILIQAEIIHIRAMSLDGINGLSPIDLANNTMQIIKSAEGYASSFFSGGVNPTGILEHPGKLSADVAKRLKQDFETKYAGKPNATLLLEEGMKWTQISLTNEQSQFLQTRQFEVVEICRWFGVPPHKAMDLSRATFSNIEHQAQEFVTDSLRPWMTRIEMAFITNLFPVEEWENYSFEFLADALLRGDISSRYEAYKIGINNGILSPDEVRAMENRNPLPEGKGKVFWKPLNIGEIGEADPVVDSSGVVHNDQVDAVDSQDQVDNNSSRAISILISEIAGRVQRRWQKESSGANFNLDKFNQSVRRDFEKPVQALSIYNSKIDGSQLIEEIIEKTKDESLDFSGWILEKI